MDKATFLKNNKGMIVKIASQHYFNTSKFTIDDLISVGNEAALRAFELHDKNRASMSTYLFNVIRNEIINFISKNKFDIYVTPYIQKKSYNFQPVGSDSQVELRKNLTNSPLAIPISYSEDDQYGVNISSIPSGAPPIPDTLIKKEQETILMEEVNSLPKRERDVIMARFFDNKKLVEVASGYGISKQRVEQIQNKALGRLRTKMFKRLDGSIAV